MESVRELIDAVQVCREVGKPSSSDVKKKPGSKYRRFIGTGHDDQSDIYDILEAYEVTCPARQHAAKKLLCAGLRGSKDALQDLQEAAQAVQRAIELEEQRKSTCE